LQAAKEHAMINKIDVVPEMVTVWRKFHDDKKLQNPKL